MRDSIRRLGVGFLLVLAGCASPAEEPAQEDPVNSGGWTIQYHDGSGNGTKVWREGAGVTARFEYEPVTPERSSSGTYSGGEPKQGEVSDAQADELWAAAQALAANGELHTDKRMMLTGSFALQGPDGESSFIVLNTPELQSFDALIARLRE